MINTKVNEPKVRGLLFKGLIEYWFSFSPSLGSWFFEDDFFDDESNKRDLFFLSKSLGGSLGGLGSFFELLLLPFEDGGGGDIGPVLT